MTKVSFHSIQRFTIPLELIHIDIGDLKFVQARGGKKYYIIFIDDCTKYCYIYVFEALEAFKNYKIKVEFSTGEACKKYLQ